MCPTIWRGVCPTILRVVHCIPRFARLVQRVSSCVNFHLFLRRDIWMFDLSCFAAICCYSFFAKRPAAIQFSLCRFSFCKVALCHIKIIIDNGVSYGSGYNSPLYGSIFLMLIGVAIPGLICKCTVPLVNTCVIRYGPLNLSWSLFGS